MQENTILLFIRTQLEPRGIYLREDWLTDTIQKIRQEQLDLFVDFENNQQNQEDLLKWVYFHFLKSHLRNSSTPRLPLDIKAISSKWIANDSHQGFVLEIEECLEVGTAAHRLYNIKQQTDEGYYSQGHKYVEIKRDEDDGSVPVISFPRAILKITLTDGYQAVTAMEMRLMQTEQGGKFVSLSMNTPRGTKIMVHNVKVIKGILLLDSTNIKFIGGVGDEPKPLEELEEMLCKRLGRQAAPLDQSNINTATTSPTTEIETGEPTTGIETGELTTRIETRAPTTEIETGGSNPTTTTPSYLSATTSFTRPNTSFVNPTSSSSTAKKRPIGEVSFSSPENSPPRNSIINNSIARPNNVIPLVNSVNKKTAAAEHFYENPIGSSSNTPFARQDNPFKNKESNNDDNNYIDFLEKNPKSTSLFNTLPVIDKKLLLPSSSVSSEAPIEVVDPFKHIIEVADNLPELSSASSSSVVKQNEYPPLIQTPTPKKIKARARFQVRKKNLWLKETPSSLNTCSSSSESYVSRRDSHQPLLTQKADEDFLKCIMRIASLQGGSLKQGKPFSHIPATFDHHNVTYH
ncbi:12129_t:CDS:2, partial [Ambispora gerdemannii]